MSVVPMIHTPEFEQLRAEKMDEIKSGLVASQTQFMIEFAYDSIAVTAQRALPTIQKLLYETSGWNGFRDDAWNDGEKIALIHSEITEAWDAWTTGANDDKLTDVSGVVCELADVVIRVLDFAEHHGEDLSKHMGDWSNGQQQLARGVYGLGLETMASSMLRLHTAVSMALEEMRAGRSPMSWLSVAVAICLGVSVYYPDNLAVVIIRKAIYNANRPYKHGKKF